MGCKDVGITKSDFAAKTQFLCSTKAGCVRWGGLMDKVREGRVGKYIISN